MEGQTNTTRSASLPGHYVKRGNVPTRAGLGLLFGGQPRPFAWSLPVGARVNRRSTVRWVEYAAEEYVLPAQACDSVGAPYGASTVSRQTREASVQRFLAYQ